MTRPVYWSVRRELWENRSIYIAPMIVAGVALFSFLISTIRLPNKMRGLAALAPEKQIVTVVTPYSLSASMILFTGIIVAAFYCLDALNGERRDRSILFWKSLPVSDRTTVLSKAAVAIAVQPLVGFAIAHAVQFVMLMASTAVLLANGITPATVWSRLPLLQMPVVMFYGLVVHALWYAPVYCWLLLVSAWARRVVILWAVLPFFMLFVIERLTIGTAHVSAMLKYRMIGAMSEAFAVDAMHAPIIRLSQLSPLGFLSTPGLWAGLVVAALCLAATVRLRRNREPN